jgi:hypothetical protein
VIPALLSRCRRSTIVSVSTSLAVRRLDHNALVPDRDLDLSVVAFGDDSHRLEQRSDLSPLEVALSRCAKIRSSVLR